VAGQEVIRYDKKDDDEGMQTMGYLHGLQEAREIIVHADQRMNLECTEVDAKNRIIIHKGYESQHLFEIEEFVDTVIGDHSSRAQSVDTYGERVLKRFGIKINNWLDRYSDIYRYSPCVEAFYVVCRSIGLLNSYPPVDFQWQTIERGRGNERLIKLVYELVNQLYVYCHSRVFKESERLRLINGERNQQNVLAMEEAMFSEEVGRSRWLILSLTLRYKPDYRQAITPEIIQQHRHRFFAARRYNQLMSGIKNYAWTIEQGEDTGLHLHVILFYSAESNRDEYIAMQIGEYWANTVTEGEGDYWNSNAGKLKIFYRKHGHGVGVGQINWDDQDKRIALRKNLTYLVKTEQYLMLKIRPVIRTFGTGQLPRKSKPGRPRKWSHLCRNDTDFPVRPPLLPSAY